MGQTIAVTGKGGVGKTATAALIVRLLVEAKQGAVLAVDADPNLNLDAALGLKAEETVGDLREEGLDRTASLPGGMAKAEFLRMRIQQALVESKGFDLLVMGRPEGPGCYCFANSILRACVDKIGKQYRYIVIDCEAGLEHLSRRTAGDVDVLILLSDLSVRGLDTAARVLELVAELDTKVGKTAFAFTRPADGFPAELQAAAKERGLPEPHVIPEDPELRDLDVQGKPLVEVSEESQALEAVRSILRGVGVLK
ncbi:MAG: AAA family ATPase [Armatimonadota bacterium]|nr:MAG: AAA family ATPase [Armatimonadota bacterium]